MIIHDCIQYSPEWWSIRGGIPTASEFDKILTPVKCELSKSAEGYINQLIADRISLTPPFFTERPGHTAAMRNGADWEPEARKWYAYAADLDVREVGFITTDDGRFGASPDGLVIGAGGEPIGGLELKCPQHDTQVSYLREGTLPTAYKCQVHGQLFVTGLPWVDFVSYCRGLPGFKIRVGPDDFTAKLAVALEGFHVNLMAALERMRKR